MGFKLTPGKKLFFILALTILCLFIDLPRNFPLKIETSFLKISKTLTRRGPDFDLVLGLDLVGGVRLVFEADLGKVLEENRIEALSSLKEVIERRVNLFGISEPNIYRSSFGGKERITVELPGVYDVNEATEVVGKTAQLVFAEIDEEGNLSPTDLTGADLKESSVIFDQVNGEPGVGLEFTSEGAQKFAELTKKNVGKLLPIVLDDEVVSAPEVEEEIANGSARISGNFSVDEAKKLSVELNAGALPVPINLVDERSVSASLGSEAVQKSVVAGVTGIALVFIFMIIIYRKLGLVADIGLLVFGVFILAIYKLIPVVLTLPGIAGFLLSVGMAVDSNILIFERFREEKRKGVNLIYALETSFGRSWDSIRDANVATLVTAFVLANPLDWNFLHTSGPIRGFAITLAIGIGVSLFTGIVVSRNLLRFFIRDKNDA